jgi:3-isopropylmalate/(R)-2-methylmalate dehydratase small subunit
MDKIIRIESKTMVLPLEDVDTDQIIPARFLTTTTREGIGKALFADWRYDANGEPQTDFVLNRPEIAGCEVLVAGRNFGCGSSREHAPWALVDFGIRAVVSTAIADIFRSNSLKNGLVPVITDADTHQYLLDNPGITVVVDMEECTLSLPDGRSVEFPIDGFSRHCIMNGIDQLGFLQQQEAAIADFEADRPWKP